MAKHGCIVRLSGVREVPELGGREAVDDAGQSVFIPDGARVTAQQWENGVLRVKLHHRSLPRVPEGACYPMWTLCHFQVRTQSPMDDAWQSRDDLLIAAAGRNSDFSGAGCGSNECAGRGHGWEVSTFQEARALKEKLESVPLVCVTIREV